MIHTEKIYAAPELSVIGVVTENLLCQSDLSVRNIEEDNGDSITDWGVSGI